MKVRETTLEGVVIIEPEVFGDERGFFMEGWKASTYTAAGLPAALVQANVSRSAQGVLRGLHYQHPQAQGKLVCVLEGTIFDVAVDIRPDSSGFGQWTGVELSAENHRQLWVPEGFAHGFCVTGGPALVFYMCSSEFSKEHDAAIAWNDPDIGIRWPLEHCTVSSKDGAAPRLADVARAKLPRRSP